MSDLPHVDQGDIFYQESFAESADTEALAQKWGQDLNYLKDELPIVAAALSSALGAAAFFTPFTFNGTLGNGDTIIASIPTGTIYGAIIFSPQVLNQANPSPGMTGGPAPVFAVQGTNVGPFINPSFANVYGGGTRYDCFSQGIFASMFNTGVVPVPYNFTGVMIHS